MKKQAMQRTPLMPTLTALENAQKLRPDLVEAQNLKGQLQYQNQDLKGAESTLKQAIETSKDPLAYYNLGMVYKKDGKFAEAKAAFLDALNGASAGEIAFKAATQLGMLHATQGDLPNAKYYFERAVALSPGNAKYHYNLALILHQTGENERALDELGEARREQLGHRLLSDALGLARLHRATLRLDAAGLSGSVAREPWPPGIPSFAEIVEGARSAGEAA